MKVWMWQRLWKFTGKSEVREAIEPTEDGFKFCMRPRIHSGWHWLCPKPQLVLVDRKHLGGVE